MFKKIINTLLGKDAAKQCSPEMKKDMNYYITDIQKILNIELPEIQIYDCFFQTPNYVGAQTIFNKEGLPADAIVTGGYTLDEDGRVIIGNYVQDNDYDKQEVIYKRLTFEEQIYILAHELRHVWQKQYHYNTYYQVNAVGDECVNDIAEIDADGFAISYCFSDQANFTSNDMPFQLNQIALQAEIEGGHRWAKAYEIASELGFSNPEKIDVAKSNVDWALVNFEKSLLKLQGRF